MILNIIIVISIILNIITIFFLNKKKIKNYIYKSKIKKIYSIKGTTLAYFKNE